MKEEEKKKKMRKKKKEKKKQWTRELAGLGRYVRGGGEEEK